MHAPVDQPARQRRHPAGVEVGGEARVGDGVELLGQRGVVGDDQPAGRAAQALVGAHGHHVRAFVQRVLPGAAGEHAREVRGVEHQRGTHLVGDGAQIGHRVLEQVQAAAGGDQPWFHVVRQPAQRIDVDAVAHGVDRRVHRAQAEPAGSAGLVVRDVAADVRRRRDQGVARLAGGHEHVEVAQGAGGHAYLGVAGAEHLGRQLGRHDLDLLDGLQAHLVLVARVAERGARAQAARQQRLGGRVHHVAGGIEVDALAVVDAPVVLHQPVQLRYQIGSWLRPRGLGQTLDKGFGVGGNPGAGGELRHGGQVNWAWMRAAAWAMALAPRSGRDTVRASSNCWKLRRVDRS